MDTKKPKKIKVKISATDLKHFSPDTFKVDDMWADLYEPKIISKKTR